MKRIKSACLEQTLLFSLKDDMPAEQAGRLLRAELDQYKTRMEMKRVRYRITRETVLPDGSIEIAVRKQYLAHDCGDYLDE